MEQQSPTSNGNGSDSTENFGWKDYTVNPGQYHVPKASDIPGNAGASFEVVEGGGNTGVLDDWQDYTTKTDRNDIIVPFDEADGGGSIYTLNGKYPMIGVPSDGVPPDGVSSENQNNDSTKTEKYPVRIKNPSLAERFGINEEMLKQKCKRIGTNVLAVGLKAVPPNYVADLVAAGIVSEAA